MAARRSKIQEEVDSIKSQKEKTVSERKTAEAELEKVFVLNFGRKKELNNNIEALKKEEKDLGDKIWKKKTSLPEIDREEKKQKQSVDQILVEWEQKEREAEKELKKLETAVLSDETVLVAVEKYRKIASDINVLLKNFHTEFIAKEIKEDNYIDKVYNAQKELASFPEGEIVSVSTP